MSLIAELEATARPSVRCIVGRWFDTLAPDELADAEKWLAAGGQKSALLRVARSRGYSGSSAMFYTHTLGNCSCPVTQ
ncbi:hypothetical protein [Nocardia carnea]|uniref:hypothetical protein n=1 Tax=Nocardia carnea TaxID=37328 RepID=UPI0024583124|nr:hypothetical protein [Nocardia carnea]